MGVSDGAWGRHSLGVDKDGGGDDWVEALPNGLYELGGGDDTTGPCSTGGEELLWFEEVVEQNDLCGEEEELYFPQEKTAFGNANGMY